MAAVKEAFAKLAHQILDKDTVEKTARTMVYVALSIGLGYLLGVVLSNEDSRTDFLTAVSTVQQQLEERNQQIAQLQTVVDQLQQPNSDTTSYSVFAP